MTFFILAIQKRYYAAFLEGMSAELENFYINGIYFRDQADISKFCDFFRWLKKVNRKNGKISKDALSYAMFEILAEYKRRGISKVEILRAMLIFGMPFLLKEIPARKQRAIHDGQKCINSAEKIGLKQSGGSPEFPIFSQK